VIGLITFQHLSGKFNNALDPSSAAEAMAD